VDGNIKTNDRYFPSAPVQCSTSNGTGMTNGGAEAYLELQKALNIVGDYRLSTPCNVLRWAIQNDAGPNDTDFTYGYASYHPNGTPIKVSITNNTNAFVSNVGSQCFAMAINLETSNGVEISGLNAEEQADISLIAQWKKPQSIDNGPSSLEVYVYYDAMIILRENNVLELVQ
jgi:hypothetical protein